jgi:hypothetical protein
MQPASLSWPKAGNQKILEGILKWSGISPFFSDSPLLEMAGLYDPPFLLRNVKPCPSPEVKFCLRQGSSFRAGLGIAPNLPCLIWCIGRNDCLKWAYANSDLNPLTAISAAP